MANPVALGVCSWNIGVVKRPNGSLLLFGL